MSLLKKTAAPEKKKRGRSVKVPVKFGIVDSPNDEDNVVEFEHYANELKDLASFLHSTQTKDVCFKFFPDKIELFTLSVDDKIQTNIKFLSNCNDAYRYFCKEEASINVKVASLKKSFTPKITKDVIIKLSLTKSGTVNDIVEFTRTFPGTGKSHSDHVELHLKTFDKTFANTIIKKFNDTNMGGESYDISTTLDIPQLKNFYLTAKSFFEKSKKPSFSVSNKGKKVILSCYGNSGDQITNYNTKGPLNYISPRFSEGKMDMVFPLNVLAPCCKVDKLGKTVNIMFSAGDTLPIFHIPRQSEEEKKKPKLQLFEVFMVTEVCTDDGTNPDTIDFADTIEDVVEEKNEEAQVEKYMQHYG